MASKESQPMGRRTMLRGGGLAMVGGAAMVAAPASRLLGATPPQVEGPFHPVNRDTDLTRKGPSDALAQGRVIYIEGTIRDDVSKAVLSNVVVELWQADINGFYDHPADPRKGKRDENFQFWGRALTGANGGFLFKTIKPGSYPAGPGWDRPPHLHFRFQRRGYHELTTQMYFADEGRLNTADRLLRSLPPAEQTKLIVSFASSANIEAGAKIGQFVVEMAAIR